YKYITVPSIPDNHQIKKPSPTTKPSTVSEASNSLEAMNPDQIFQNPAREDKLIPPPPPVYLDEIDGDEASYDAVQIEPEGVSNDLLTSVSWKAFLRMKKTLVLIGFCLFLGLIVGIFVGIRIK
ncbi:MAG: hypothetical protein ACK47R_04025, partial [Planctomycetia bacterium]